MTLTVGSLFSGIGGLDLGLERAGMEIKWNCEIDPYCCRVLARHWPTTPNLGDVTTVDWSTVERVDVIAGGYPCQPFSYAGRRGGADDPRHLWPHFANALRHLRPRYAVLENVPGHLSLGFGRVLGDLAELGFDAEWDCIPAAAVGAPHLRYRVFVVAHANSEGQPGKPVDAVTRPRQLVSDAACSGSPHRCGPREGRRAVFGCPGHTLVDPTRVGCGEGPRIFGGLGPAERGWWRTEPDVGGTLDGFSTWLDGSERLSEAWHGHWEDGIDRVAHGVPSRVDRLRALGNAVVPQVAELVGRRVMEMTSCN